MGLSQFAINNAKPQDKPYLLSDGDGLHLRVHPKGGYLTMVSLTPGEDTLHAEVHSLDGGQTFFDRHGLTIVTGSILLLWIVLYSISDEKRHIGSFFGNAIADWSGVVVMVLATKHLYERGSIESKEPKTKSPNRALEILREHSLTVFLFVTGVGWVLLYAHSDSESKWGQVAGNIVSEWTQIIGLVLLTKKLVETGSKESKGDE